ncbi:hypothetical protein NGH72_13335 [Staphylococcus pseudoxylosus]|uniref:hypothetical protein n=1 Tax=Staphylococcus pseudoxylosus TaxID=2282419 RepID=UPI002DBCF4AA|nr:hypothetical protein [Staphylococcus pseudoxylosus]MEB8010282.1 hypothetical protein [Staphylococcus pseudoxylosus]
MVSKHYKFDEDTISKINTIKEAKGIRTEKNVIVEAIDHYILSEMIEYDSLEYKNMQMIKELTDQVEKLYKKTNNIDLNVSINNLFLAGEFEMQRHPRGIIHRDTLESYYLVEARKEIQKSIREKDSHNRKRVVKDASQPTKESEMRKSIIDDDDWLNV